MLLDMVMLSGGIEQVVQRAAARPRLPDPAHAQGHAAVRHRGLDPGATGLVVEPSAPSPASRPRARCSAPRSTARTADSLVTLFGYGIQPEAQAIYQVTAGADLAPGRHARRAAERDRRRAAPRRRPGDTRDAWSAGSTRRSPARRWAAGSWCAGMVRWLYDYRGQPSVGTVLPVMQRLGRRDGRGPGLAAPGEGRGRRARCPRPRRAAARAVPRARGEQRRRPGGCRPSAAAGLLHASSPTSSAA